MTTTAYPTSATTTVARSRTSTTRMRRGMAKATALVLTVGLIAGFNHAQDEDKASTPAIGFEYRDGWMNNLPALSTEPAAIPARSLRANYRDGWMNNLSNTTQPTVDFGVLPTSLAPPELRDSRMNNQSTIATDSRGLAAND